MVSKLKQFTSAIGSVLDESLSGSDDSAPKVIQRNPNSNVLAASAGKRKQVSIISVNPKRCKLWNLHNRNQELLSEETCKDIIDSIKLNGQLEPALAREVHNDPNFDFEIIYGSRRRFACTVLGKDIQIRLTTANDRECAALMDAENRARKDISDYERALDYKRWLDAKLYNTQKDLAESIGMDPGNLNKLMKLVELPDFIISAFKSPLDIKSHYAPDLLKLLQNSRVREKIYDKARWLKGKNLEGSKVFKSLVDAAKEAPRKSKDTIEPIKSTAGEVICHLKKKGQGGLELSLFKELTLENVDVLKSKILFIIDNYYAGKL